jgi:putative hemolysin
MKSMVLAEGTSSGAIEKNEHAMVRNLFRLDDRQIGSLMCRAPMWCAWTSLPALKRTWR